MSEHTIAHIEHRSRDLLREREQRTAHWEASKAKLEALGIETAERVKAIDAELAALRAELEAKMPAPPEAG